ncbi:PAS domain S-box-containing protein [Bacillus tianshenii]|uniref:histidine kinase n=1 Tax=Sutcliffiella tianshenii TaxID=1463404 RepID=A0ABS2P1J5_9BACI|nr:ATP-binding protein [Bacillus tianshenii]MBM7620751.1 PAS domain S-box-containing protein [Bacillus tianshenii]
MKPYQPNFFTGFYLRLAEQWNLEKKDTNVQLAMIHKRNKLLLIVFVTLSILDTITNLFVFPSIVLPVILLSLVGCSVTLYFVLQPRLAKIGMYVIVCTSFLPFWVVAYLDKDVINYIFLTMPLIMSSVYNRIMPTLLASAITLVTLTYFYFFYFHTVFYENIKVDVVYFLLFTLFVTVYLLFSSTLNERFRLRAEEKEKETSRELLSTKEYLEAYFTNTTDAIGVYDLNGEVLQINASFENIFQIRADDVVGERTDFLPFTKKENLSTLLNSMEEKKNVTFETATSPGILSLEVKVTVTPIKNPRGKIIALIFLMEDITDKKRTEEALMQSEKLSVIGELAAGVAHEIRNPVTVLKGFVQLLAQQRTIPDPYYFNIMQKELDRINQITNEFMALAKPQAVKIKNQNLLELIFQVTDFLESEALLHKVELLVEHEEAAIWIDCEPNQIKQVLINTIKNGIEAMPEGGKIRIKVKKEQNFIYLLIEDEGTGIPSDLIERIGQPFFTTKEQGTGLGLMVSMKIIENHGGAVSIQSQENKGTIVKILLPLHK